MKLEIGVGGGSYTFKSKIRGEDVIYADIERPKKRMKNFIVCDAQFLPFMNNVLSEIIAAHIIEHLDSPQLFIKESQRLLIRGGKIRIWCPNFTSENATKDPSHKYIFNFLSLRKVVLFCGFQCVHNLPNIGSIRVRYIWSRLPHPFRFFSKPVVLLLCDELYVEGVKQL